MVTDMATVVDAADLKSFALLGISQGCAYSIRYAVEHPEQVLCLVLHGGFTRGRLKRNSAEQSHLYEAGRTMIREGWGSPNPLYRSFFASNMIPDATREQSDSFDELQRISISAENAERIWEANANIDVSELARRITAPTLVLHCEGDRICPLDEGRRMAALIPGARFVPLEGNNHVVLEGTPAFDVFIAEINDFLQEHSS